MGKNLRLVIVVPSGRTWEAKFGMCLAQMLVDFSHPLEGYESQQVQVLNKVGSILPQLRNKALLQAEQMKATHLLFVDSDQTFPADTARRLIAHDLPIVACNIATKSLPSKPTARLKSEEPSGRLVYSHESKGLQRVWRVGTGIMLIKLSAIERVSQPRFDICWKEEIQDHQGEDWFFCEKLEAAGIPIRIDHDLSREVGHVGEMVYDHQLVQMGVLQDDIINAVDDTVSPPALNPVGV